MKRRIIFLIVTLFALTMLIGIGYKTYIVVKTKNKAKHLSEHLPTHLPFNFIYKTKDTFVHLSTVINYFSPDCEHCQYMTKKLISNYDSFKQANIIMITPAKYNEAVEFYEQYHLRTFPKISLAVDTNFLFYKLFGSLNIPSFFIYDSTGRLEKKYDGETRISNIIHDIQP